MDYFKNILNLIKIYLIYIDYNYDSLNFSMYILLINNNLDPVFRMYRLCIISYVYVLLRTYTNKKFKNYLFIY